MEDPLVHHLGSAVQNFGSAGKNLGSAGQNFDSAGKNLGSAGQNFDSRAGGSRMLKKNCSVTCKQKNVNIHKSEFFVPTLLAFSLPR